MVYVIFVVASFFLEWLWGLVEDSIACSETRGQDVLLEASNAPSSHQTRVEQNPVLWEPCLLWIVCEVICLFCGLSCGWRGNLVGAVTGTNSGVSRNLFSNLGGGLILRWTSGVPILPTWRGKGTRGQFLIWIFGWLVGRWCCSSLCCS